MACKQRSRFKLFRKTCGWKGWKKRPIFKLTRSTTCDFEFESCVLNGISYSSVDCAGFSQWIYLILPETFQAALEGTCWEESNLAFIQRAHAYLERGCLIWEIVVNYLVCSCCASGIRTQPRKFNLIFHN